MSVEKDDASPVDSRLWFIEVRIIESMEGGMVPEEPPEMPDYYHCYKQVEVVAVCDDGWKVRAGEWSGMKLAEKVLQRAECWKDIPTRKLTDEEQRVMSLLVKKEW